MPEQLRLSDVRSEYLVPEARPFFMALAPAMSIRLRSLEEYRKRGYPDLTQLDGAILFHCFTWAIVGGNGTRQSEMLDHFHLVNPATMRGALKRLVRVGLLTRQTRAMPGSKVPAVVYHPTVVVGQVQNAMFEANMAVHARMAETFTTYRAATGW